MAAKSTAGYREWLEHEGTSTVLIYSGLVVVLLPAFHFFLSVVPAPRPDSLALRLLGAAFSAAVAAAVWFVPPLRRYAAQLQILNLLPALLVVIALVVNSGNSPFYVASGLLVVLGLQQAFFRLKDIAFVFAAGALFHIAYSFSLGYRFDRVNTMTIVIYATAYVIAFFPSVIAMRSRERVLYLRFEAEAARAEAASQLARQTVITRIVEYIRSTFDLQDIIDNVVTALGSQMHGDRICIALWDERAEAMIVRGEFRRDPLLTPAVLGTELKSKRWSKFYRRLLAGQSILMRVDGAAQLAHSQREFFELSGTKEFFVAPVHSQHPKQLLGFLALGLTQAQGAISPDDCAFLEAIAAQVAIAIQQSRVYEQLQEEIDYRRRQEARLSDLANRDPLTGIFNRRYFLEEVQRSIDRCSPETARGAVFFLDLDRFKIVNDTLGHDAGDRVLMAIPKVIRSALRELDVLARIGGDEFAVLLPDLRQTETLRVAEKIRKCVAGYSFREGGRAFDLGVSIGVALIDGAARAQDLMQRADEACYKAKAEGRNAVHLWCAGDFA